jgi:hypothetical protein
MADSSTSDVKWGWWIAATFVAFLFWQGSQDDAKADRPIYTPAFTPATGSPSYGGSSYSGDLDCSDFSGPVAVNGADPHGLDRDGDGVGCEANG